MKLSELQPGHSAKIVKVLGHGAFRKRMMEMGFVKGHVITDILKAPLQDPVKYSIMGYEVSLRRSEADMVEVEPIDADADADAAAADAVAADAPHSHASDDDDGRIHGELTVVLIGNPNCGKTTLFNIAAGAREHTGNYSGVTVDSKTGTLVHRGYRINLVDLPGTYSLAAYSPEEKYVRRWLEEHNPDVIINVVDGTNLERNLYLTTELIDMNRPMVIDLNMMDELERDGTQLDYRTLGGMIGVPIVPTDARSGQGVDRLLDTVVDVAEDRDTSVRHVHVLLGPALERAIAPLNAALKKERALPHHFSPRFYAIRLLSGDPEAEAVVAALPDGKAILAERDAQTALLAREFPGEDVATLIASEKYGFISGALAETLVKGRSQGAAATQIVDTIVTSRALGFPIFLCVMAAIFWATFQIGSYPMEWIEDIVAWLGSLVGRVMPDGALKDLISDGIIGGVGGVIVFLPNILILYFCISFMEDSGYMARAAFIMDRIMHRMGIHGKSFIPLIMGFGCNVPAVMACRAIESRSSRLITILINPFMSCSARLPVYVLLVGVFCPGHATLAFMALYLTGIAVAVVTARLLRRFWFGADETPFVMELPPYRIPTLKASLRHMWAKGQQYLRKMGGIILLASIFMWALNYFPLRNEDSSVPGENLRGDSYLEMAGKAVNPVMEPLGFNWRATVAALAGIPAKEIVVSTLGVLYTGDEEASDRTLATRITAPSPLTGRPGFTTASAWSFMIFILLYCPCIATVTAVVKETGHWGYGLFSVCYNTAVAWIIAFAVYCILA